MPNRYRYTVISQFIYTCIQIVAFEHTVRILPYVLHEKQDLKQKKTYKIRYLILYTAKSTIEKTSFDLVSLPIFFILSSFH